MLSESGKGKMVIILVLAVVALLAGLGIIVLKSKKSSEPAKVPTSEMKLGEFIVNLADTNEIRYLKTNIVLEVEGAKPAGGGHGGHGGGGDATDPRVRDAIIQVMSSKRFTELQSPEGKEKLKEQIAEAVNERKKEEHIKVVEVFFNEFAMQ